jgi:cytochrome c553
MRAVGDFFGMWLVGGWVFAAAAGAMLLAAGAMLLAAGAVLLAARAVAAEAELIFEDRVSLILERRCVHCHHGDKKKGELDLSSATGILAGGESGPVITAGDPSRSRLYEVIRNAEMPPEGEALSPAEAVMIERWIAGGAHFRQAAMGDKPIQWHEVMPVLLLRCAACHGAQLQRGGFDIRSYASLVAGGDSGPAVVAGDADASRLIQRVEEQLCPPKNQLLKYFVKRPTEKEQLLLRQWIGQGAVEGEMQPDVATTTPDPLVTDEDRQHWAFQPLPAKVPVPGVVAVAAIEDDWDALQPLDAFIVEQHQAQGLSFSPMADREVLIRRAYYALIGLPPSVADFRRWLESTDHRWYPAMIDELLASPHYGERWGRYWLDIAGYADSEGGVSEDIVRDLAWKYRDYVIRAHNQDKPWNRFLLEQLAGDELEDFRREEEVTAATIDNLIATGFLRMGIDQTGSRTMNFQPERLGVIADALNVVGTGLMGLTMECARCHSHKYDPIPQRDYYRLKAIFQGAFDEHDWMSWKNRTLEVASPQMRAESKSVNAPLEKEIKQLESERQRLLKERREAQYAAVWPKLSPAEQQEITAALKETVGRRTLRQDDLVIRYEREIRPNEANLRKLYPEIVEPLSQLDQRLDRLREQLYPPFTIRALWDRGQPSPTYQLIGGEHDRSGALVGPGVPSVLTDGRTPFLVEKPWTGAESTGRRLAFARWLTSPDHPLTARVLVNRVWKHHFGQGLVPSLDNFGTLTPPPSHPALLDWLARDFIDGGWSLKKLHRTIMLSRTYRQASQRDVQAEERDPENRWLWRMSLQRLDAEAMRDAMLAMAGRLSSKLYGPPAEVQVREDGLISDVASHTGMHRRSLYLRLRRTELPSLLSTFDYPDMQPNCSQRTTSTVSPQSLMLSNNAQIYGLAADIGRRIAATAGSKGDPAAAESSGNPASASDRQVAIRHAFELILNRVPSPAEMERCQQAMVELDAGWRADGMSSTEAGQRALTTFCHTLLNSAAFLYVD